MGLGLKGLRVWGLRVWGLRVSVLTTVASGRKRF